MKKFIYFSALSLMLSALIAMPGCGNKNDSTPAPAVSPAPVGTVIPADTYCLQNPYDTRCNNSIYNQSGWMTYNYYYQNTTFTTNYFTTYGFCGCQSGYQAAYNASFGLGCFYSNSYPAANTVPIYGQVQTIPLVSNIGPNSASVYSTFITVNATVSSGCNTQAYYSCVIGQINSCPSGQVCHQQVAGSTLGVCGN